MSSHAMSYHVMSCCTYYITNGHFQEFFMVMVIFIGSDSGHSIDSIQLSLSNSLSVHIISNFYQRQAQKGSFLKVEGFFLAHSNLKENVDLP